MPPDPLEGARASPRRDRYAITNFGALRVPRPPVTQILEMECEKVRRDVVQSCTKRTVLYEVQQLLSCIVHRDEAAIECARIPQ